MSRGFVVDAGVLQQAAKERPPVTPLRDRLRHEYANLVTIPPVLDECWADVIALLIPLRIHVEPACEPPTHHERLDCFSAGLRKLPWRDDLVPRADRAVFAHAIAGQYDILTTDGRMASGGTYREFLRRLSNLPDNRLPPWRLPEVIEIRRPLFH